MKPQPLPHHSAQKKMGKAIGRSPGQAADTVFHLWYLPRILDRVQISHPNPLNQQTILKQSENI